MPTNPDLSATSASHSLRTGDRRTDRASDRSASRTPDRPRAAEAAKPQRKHSVEKESRPTKDASGPSTFDRALERSRARASEKSEHDGHGSNTAETQPFDEQALAVTPELELDFAGDGTGQDTPTAQRPTDQPSLGELLSASEAKAKDGAGNPAAEFVLPPPPLPVLALPPGSSETLADESGGAPEKTAARAKTIESLVPSATTTTAEKREVELAREAPAAPSGPRVQNAERAAEILRQVRVQLLPETRQAVIRLHPAELGRVSIHLEVRDRGVDAVVRAERQETLAALDHHLPELRAHLASSGLEVRDIQLSLGFDDRSNPRSGDGAGRSGAPNARADEGSEPSALETAVLTRAVGGASGIDTYA